MRYPNRSRSGPRGWNLPSRGLWVLALLCAAAPVFGCCDRGLLFRIEPVAGPAAAGPSWLFGTIHSDDPRVTRLGAPVGAAFAGSQVLVLELLPDPPTLAAVVAAMTFDDGRTLEQVLPPPVYRDTLAALAERGLPAAAAERMRPWAVLLLLAAPPSQGGEVLDFKLYRDALAAGKTVVGLERADEQIGVFADLSDADQVALLIELLASRDALAELIEALIDAWLAGDLAALRRLGEAPLRTGDAALSARLRSTLIDGRNRTMAARIVPLVRSGGQFIAVGALHLPGPGGLLERLAAAGFRVEPAD